MAFALIAKAAAGSSDQNNVTTGSINSTGADLLIACVGDFGGGTVSTVTDSKGNTWHGLTARQTGTVARARIWWSTPSSVGSGHTATASSSGQFPAIDFRAYSGSNIAGPFDVENGNTASSGTIATGSITPSQANSLVVSCGVGDSGSGFTVNGSFTNLDNAAGSANNEALGGADLIQTSIAAANPTWTNSLSTNLAAAIAAFKPLAGFGRMLEVF